MVTAGFPLPAADRKPVDCGMVLCQHKLFTQNIYDVPGQCDSVSVNCACSAAASQNIFQLLHTNLQSFDARQDSHVILLGKEMQ
jgi:hypothetical protein